MNKPSMLTTLLFVLIMCTSAVMAAPSIQVGSDITGTVEQKETYEDSFTITNNGDDNLSIDITVQDLLLTTDNSEKISKGNLKLSATSISKLETGENKEITLSYEADDNQEIGTYEGTIDIEYDNGTEKNTASIDVSIEVSLGNHLVIKRVNLEIDGDRQRMSDGEKFDEDVKPRAEMSLEIIVENDFRDNIDIEDIEITITGDGDLDWDDNDDIGDLSDGDDDTITFTHDVPEAADIDDGTYDIEIKVEGVDENGNNHGEIMVIEIEVDRAKYDLQFQSIDFNPSYLDCGESFMQVSMDIENVGSRDVDEGTLTIESTAFKQDVIVRNIEIDESDDETKTITLPIKDDLSAGTYYLTFQLYSTASSSDDTDVASRTITVLSCGDEEVEQEEEEEDQTEIEVITPTPTVPVTGGQVVATSTGKETSTSFLQNDDSTYLVLLIVIIVLLIILIGVALTSLGKKK